MGAFKLLRGRPSVLSVNFGVKNRIGMGGYPTNETPSSSLTGTNHGDFAIDDIGTLVPASGGAGTYGAAWTQTGGATSYSLIGASGAVYNITIQTGKIYIATRNGAPTHPDNGANGVNDTQLYRTLALSTASGGPALDDQILWRTGSAYNPTNAVWGLDLPSVASFTGSGRITVGSEHVDTSLDANGNPALQHGGKMGMVYFAPADASPYPVDFKNIWWHTNQSTPIAGVFFQYQNGSSGVGFYNSRFEAGASVAVPNSINPALNLQGATVVDGNHFVNIGNAILEATSTIVGPATISNNLMEGLYDDGIKVAGPAITVTRSFGFGWLSFAGNHQDGLQYSGNAITTALGPISEIIITNDRGNLVEAGIFIADQTAGFLTNGAVSYIISSQGNSHGLQLDKGDNPSITFSTVLVDPLVNPGSITDALIQVTNGQNGATITGNVANGVSTLGQTGVITSDNASFPTSGKNAAQVIAMYQVAFPNYPAANTDPLWKTRAGNLQIFTPAAGIAVAAGGAMKVGGTYYGYLFPAGTGQANGALNDGTVPLLTDPTWLAAHPAAT